MNTQFKKLLASIFVLALFTTSSTLIAQSAESGSSQGQEVYLAFRYKGAINTVVTAIAKDEQFYLPVTEIFSLLQVEYQLNIQKMAISGYYLDPGVTYTIGFREKYARIGDNRVELTADDVLLRETDFYMLPRIFREIFGLKFNVDFYHLELSLEAEETMPVVAEQQRRLRRDRETRTDYTFFQEDYPLLYDRQPHVLNGGFLDYSVFTRIARDGNLVTYNMRLGSEVLAGDLQGAVIAAHTNTANRFGTTGMRWRYVQRNTPVFSTVEIGQVASEGILGRSLTGVHMTNEPIEPRRLYDNYVIDGTTIPQSEVELYRNNRLIGFEKADEQGDYRFTIPLTYGSADLSIRIYNPSGGVTELDRRVQVPFTYIPPGEIYYHVSGGKQEADYLTWENRRSVFHANAAYGLSNKFSGKIGLDYHEDINRDTPVFYSSLATRLGLQYLMNFEVAPAIYYRVQANATYPSSAGWRVDYTYYPGQNILNRSGRVHEMNTNFYYPFSLIGRQFLSQVTSRYQTYQTDRRLGFRSLLSTNISRFRLRLGYQDIISSATSTGELSLTGTFTIPRAVDIPWLFNGMYIRTEFQYLTALGQSKQLNFQILKSFSRQGRFRVTFGKNLVGNYNTFELNFSYDFDKTRSTSAIRVNRSNPVFSQNFRGSVGYDSEYNTVIFDNRQQVGRAGASIRMFVDGDDSGTFDAGEEQIRANAIRIRNASGRITGTDTISRLTQLQAYRRYNLEINEAQIRNPVWIPKIKEFSIVTDPNSYKQIDVPFYITGIIDGNVLRRKDEELQPVAGLRLFLQEAEGTFTKTMRTFSDGSFYAMEVPPGEYYIEIDSTQLKFLGVRSNPPLRKIRVRAVPEGDFVEGLNFTLTPKTEPTEKPEAPSCKYYVQVGLFSSWSQVLLEEYIAENLFEQDFHVVYNSEYDLYAVISDHFSNSKTAGSVSELVRDRMYDDAYVAEDCPPFTQPLRYRVQLGDFAVQEGAETFYSLHQALIDEPITVKSFNDNRYHVLIGNYESWMNAVQKLDSVIKEPAFEQSTLITDPGGLKTEDVQQYNVYFGVYRQRSAAEKLRLDLADLSDVSIRTEYLSDLKITLVRSAPVGSFEEAQRLMQLITRSYDVTARILPANLPQRR